LLARTISLSESTYKKLKKLKEDLKVSYSELIEILIETYERSRIEELKKLCKKLKVSDEEASMIESIVKELRNRKWW